MQIDVPTCKLIKKIDQARSQILATLLRLRLQTDLECFVRLNVAIQPVSIA
jgi:hypothetical protein